MAALAARALPPRLLARIASCSQSPARSLTADMNEPVYEDDLTMLHPRHGTALLLLQQHAVAAKAAIDAAESEGTLNTALGNMTRVATAARTMFAGAEIKKPDMPFGEVGLETSLRGVWLSLSLLVLWECRVIRN